jgi:hypothetical protein
MEGACDTEHGQRMARRPLEDELLPIGQSAGIRAPVPLIGHCPFRQQEAVPQRAEEAPLQVHRPSQGRLVSEKVRSKTQAWSFLAILPPLYHAGWNANLQRISPLTKLKLARHERANDADTESIFWERRA